MALFKNLNLLDEKPSDFDSLEYAKEKEYVKKRIEHLVNKNKKSIIAYLGPFGVGKSTILREVEKDTPKYKWVTFEMWRYANRNELWDGFVIKIASEMSSLKSEFEIANKVDGKTLSVKEVALLVLWLFIILFISILAFYKPWLDFRSGDTIIHQYFKAYAKYALPSIITIMIVVGLGRLFELEFISNKRPLRRGFELEQLLLNNVYRMKKPLIVVVEDADRTTPDGPVFLETLNHFLNNKLSDKSQAFIVIAPQTNASFDRVDNSTNEGFERSLKIYDEKIYFNSAMSDKSIENFYNKIEVDKKYRAKITKATQIIISNYRKLITIRLLKHSLREVNQFIEMNPEANPVVVLAIILSRYVSVQDLGGRQQLGIRTVTGQQEHGSEFARSFFLAIAVGIDSYEKATTAKNFVLNFSSDNIEEAETFQHPSGSIRCTMTVSNIYELLIT